MSVNRRRKWRVEMAKFYITHSCGCKETHNIVGKESLRDGKADWLASRMCAACYKQDRTTKAAEATNHLPALTGTEKQVAWAVTIRAALILKLAEDLRQLLELEHFPRTLNVIDRENADWDLIEERAKAHIAELTSPTDAYYYIEDRHLRNSRGDNLLMPVLYDVVQEKVRSVSGSTLASSATQVDLNPL
jgi:hypothetical protein